MVALFAASTSDAQTPSYVYAPSSVTTDTVPLGSNTYNLTQYLFTPAEFSPAVPATGGTITRVYIRAGNSQSAGSTFNLAMNMGATPAATLSSASWTLGLSTIYSNATASVGAWNAGDWIPVTLQTPFVWNGSSNFVIGVYQGSFTNPLAVQLGAVSGRNGRAFGNGNNAAPSGADDKLISFGFDLACTGAPSTPTITTAAFPATAPLCSGATTTIQASFPDSPVPDGISYQWESSSSATGPWANVSGGSGATTLSYTTGALTASTYFRLAVHCSYSSTSSYSSAFLAPVGPAQPAAISGPVAFCPGDAATYSVPNISGTTYTWTLPSGWSGSSTGNSITLTPGAAAGAISVSASPACAGSTAPSLTLVPGSAPAAPGTIFGNTHICSGTSQTYTVLPIPGANSYVWTLPPGWTGTSTTTTITVTAGTASGNITVQGVNVCGQGNAGTPLIVNVLSSLPSPGTIAGKDTVCSGTLQTYSVAPIPGATAYTWILPSGWSGTTTSPSIQAFAGTSGGTLSVSASAACATSATSSLALTVIATVTPSVSITAPATPSCEHTPVTFTATPVHGGSAATYQWTKNGTNVLGAGASYTDNTLTSSDLIAVTMTSNAACASGAMVTSNAASANIIPTTVPGVSINTTPPVMICKGTAVTFSTISTGTGATPSYQWFKNGVAISGATGSIYTDAALSHNDTLTIQMTTSVQCPAMPIANSNKVGVSVADPVTPTVSIAVSPSDVITDNTPRTFTASYSNGGPTPDFQWKKNGVNIPFATGDTYESSDLKIGDHISVSMLSYAECVTTTLVGSNTIVLKARAANVGIAGNSQPTAGISIYPNPNSGRFAIAATGWDGLLSGSGVRVDVINMTGQVVYHMTFVPTATGGNSWQTQVSLDAGLANGRYMLRVSSDDGLFKTVLPFVLNK